MPLSAFIGFGTSRLATSRGAASRFFHDRHTSPTVSLHPRPAPQGGRAPPRPKARNEPPISERLGSPSSGAASANADARAERREGPGRAAFSPPWRRRGSKGRGCGAPPRPCLNWRSFTHEPVESQGDRWRGSTPPREVAQRAATPRLVTCRQQKAPARMRSPGTGGRREPGASSRFGTHVTLVMWAESAFPTREPVRRRATVALRVPRCRPSPVHATCTTTFAPAASRIAYLVQPRPCTMAIRSEGWSACSGTSRGPGTSQRLRTRSSRGTLSRYPHPGFVPWNESTFRAHRKWDVAWRRYQHHCRNFGRPQRPPSAGRPTPATFLYAPRPAAFSVGASRLFADFVRDLHPFRLDLWRAVAPS